MEMSEILKNQEIYLEERKRGYVRIRKTITIGLNGNKFKSNKECVRVREFIKVGLIDFNKIRPNHIGHIVRSNGFVADRQVLRGNLKTTYLKHIKVKKICCENNLQMRPSGLR